MPARYFTGNRAPVTAATNALDTPNKRAHHTAAGSRHALWVSIAGKRGGVSLGYRARVDQPGSWSGRLIYRGARYQTLLGTADDPGCKPGSLSYAAAAQAALAWADARKAGLESGKDDDDPDHLTLRAALVAYYEARTRRSRVAGTNARQRLTRHVLSDNRLADTRLARLTPASIAAWRCGRVMKPSSLNRLLNDLRAGITAAMPAQILPPELRAALRAEPGATEAREIQVINLADLRRLLQAADQLDASFGQLVRLLVITGARYSQVVRLRVNDLQLVPGRSRLMVPASAKGRGAKAGRLIPVPISDDVAARLRPLTYGRMGHESLLSQRTGVPWGPSGRMIARWRLALDAAGLPTGLVPYALRHTSIVRMLSQNVPIRFVAAVHDTSIAMLEAHYAKFITNEVEDRIRAAAVLIESAEIVTLPVPQHAGAEPA